MNDIIEIIPITNNEIFDKELTKDDINTLKVNEFCYSIDIDLIAKLISIENRPINNQKLFLKNILNFLVYLDSNSIDKKEISIGKEVFEYFFTKKLYKKYQTLLSELNIITRIPYTEEEIKSSMNKKFLTKNKFDTDPKWYKKGSYACKYKIHNEYLKVKDICLVVIPEGRKKYERVITIDERITLDKRFINTIDKLEVNTVNAIKAEIDHFSSRKLPLNSLKSRLNRIFYTKQRRFIKKGTKVDRIYHSFTNLSKVSRQHLNINFNYIDIKNCQPLLLVSYLIKNEMILDNDYKKDCEEGLFYEKFYDLFDIADKDELRNVVKKLIYRKLFFGFDKRSIVNKRFNKLYPNTWSSLEAISQTEESLASRLQNLEADLFNNLIPKKSNNFFTLFDAIYFSDFSDIERLNKYIKTFFSKIGVEVKVEIG